MSGMAIRHALSLGLNLRNEAMGVKGSSKEIRYRVWWAIFSVERVLIVMTGRVSSLAQLDCTITPPLPLEETQFLRNADPQTIQLLTQWSSEGSKFTTSEQTTSTPSSSQSYQKPSSTESRGPDSLSSPMEQISNIAPSDALFFYHYTKLGMIAAEALCRLYHASAMQDSWSQTLRKIKNLQDKAKKWVTGLPSVFNFMIAEQRDHAWVRHRISLGLFYYSTVMLANRPCLCRVDHRIPNQSKAAKETNQLNATTCVDAAIRLLRLLPDEPDTTALYTFSPWWCIIHHLMQAVTVLMLELTYHAEHTPSNVEEVFSSSKKCWKWLREMGRDDIAAYRAWCICDEMLRKVAPKVGRKFEEPPPARAPTLDTSVVPDSIAVPLSPPLNYYGYPASMPGQPQIFSLYNQSLNQNVPPATTDRTDFHDMFPMVDSMEAMVFDNNGFFDSENIYENTR